MAFPQKNNHQIFFTKKNPQQFSTKHFPQKPIFPLSFAQFTWSSLIWIWRIFNRKHDYLFLGRFPDPLVWVGEPDRFVAFVSICFPPLATFCNSGKPAQGNPSIFQFGRWGRQSLPAGRPPRRWILHRTPATRKHHRHQKKALDIIKRHQAPDNTIDTRKRHWTS